MSRLDMDCSLGAHILCDIAPALAQKLGKVEIFIIGGGTEYNKIWARASKINADFEHFALKTSNGTALGNDEINQQLIKMVGVLENPMEWLSAHSQNALFVGVSRASLEAMACGLPAILLGNEGYLGLLDENKLEAARKSNFTARGHGCATNDFELRDEIFNEICTYFEYDDAEKRRLSLLSQCEVDSNYSAKKMARMTLGLYEKAIRNKQIKAATKQSVSNKSPVARQNPPKIVICGYYGRGNLGDEAILGAILRVINEICLGKDCEIYVIRNKNIGKILKNLRGADLFIFGGGSLLQNTTSSASLLYYLALVRLARALCKRTIMLANGFGPIVEGKIPRKTLLSKVARAVDTFDTISARDSLSHQTLQSLLPKRKIHLVFDPALMYFEKTREKINHQLINSAIKVADARGNEKTHGGVEECEGGGNEEWDQFDESDKSCELDKYYLFCPCARSFDGVGSGISLENVAKTLVEVAKRHEIPCALLILNECDDVKIARKIADRVGRVLAHEGFFEGKTDDKAWLGDVRIFSPKTPNEAVAVIKNAKFVISQRYHGTLFAISCGKPTIALSGDPKVISLCKDFDILPAKSNKILTKPEKMADEVQRAINYWRSVEAEVSEKVERRVHLTHQSIKNILKKYIFPIDNNEQMFYNKEKVIERKEND